MVKLVKLFGITYFQGIRIRYMDFSVGEVTIEVPPTQTLKRAVSRLVHRLRHKCGGPLLISCDGDVLWSRGVDKNHQNVVCSNPGGS